MTSTNPRLSLAHLTVLDAGPLELIDAAAAGGFQSIGLRIVAPPQTAPVVPVIGVEGTLREIERKLADTGISVLDIEVAWLSAETDHRSFDALVETGARLGAEFVLAIGYDVEPHRQVENFARLAERARAVGLRAMLEFMVFSQVKTLAEARAVVRGAAVPGAGVLVDALHLWRSGGSVSDLSMLNSEELAYIQLCDGRAAASRPDDLRTEARGDRFYPGDGALDLESLLAALPPGLPISVEAPCAAYAALPAVERARLCGERTRALFTRLSGRAH